MKKTETVTSKYEFTEAELMDAIQMYLRSKEISGARSEDISFTYERKDPDNPAGFLFSGFTVITTKTNG